MTNYVSAADLRLLAFGLTADEIITRLIEDCNVSFKDSTP